MLLSVDIDGVIYNVGSGTGIGAERPAVLPEIQSAGAVIQSASSRTTRAPVFAGTLIFSETALPLLSQRERIWPYMLS